MTPTEKQIKKAMNRFEITTDGKNGFYRGCLWYAKQVEEQWVDANKRLPKDGETVLVFKHGLKSRIYAISKYLIQYGFESVSNVQFWQPLLQPPRKETGK